MYDAMLWLRKEQPMTLTIELTDILESILKSQALAHGVSTSDYARQIIEKVLVPDAENQKFGTPFETGYGMWAKYGPAPSAEEIAANRADMFQSP
jgi:hypothetical protein